MVAEHEATVIDGQALVTVVRHTVDNHESCGLGLHAAGEQMHHIPHAGISSHVARAVLLAAVELRHIANAHRYRRQCRCVGKIGSERFAKHLGYAVQILRSYRHGFVYLNILWVAFDGLGAAGKHHPPAPLGFGGMEDVIGADDICRQQAGHEIVRVWRHIGSQMDDGVDAFAGAHAGGETSHVQLQRFTWPVGQARYIQVGQAQCEIGMVGPHKSGTDTAGGAGDEDFGEGHCILQGGMWDCLDKRSFPCPGSLFADRA